MAQSSSFAALSALRKFQKMGKKGPEKGKDKSGGGDNRDDDPSKTPEPYSCTGNIDTDFTELCRRAHMTEIPPVVLRSKAPGQPPPPSQETKAPEATTTQTNVTAAGSDEVESGAMGIGGSGSGGEGGGALQDTFIPTTYIPKSNYDYMRPVVQVDADPNDKKSTVKEIYIRNWKVDAVMMDSVLRVCVPAVDKLHLLTLYNVGLTNHTLETLGHLVQECPNLKTLNVEGSPVESEEWHRLIMGENNKVWNLSLRNNRITDLGARYLGYALGTPREQNSTLVKLNLSFNNITAEGVTLLAKGLRMNRCLLVLDLSSNYIGDEGARSLASVVSRFRLTHEEVVERRIRQRDTVSPDRGTNKSPPSSRKTDRPTSKGTSMGDKKSAADKKGAGAAGAAAAKGAKGGGKDAAAGGDKKDDKKGAKGAVGEAAGAATAAKSKKTSNPPPVQVDAKAAGNKTQRGGKTTPKGPRAFSQGENENGDSGTYEQKHPLDEEVNYEEGEGHLWVKIGNRSLISLNLNRNRISEKGAYELLRAMKYQSRVHSQGPKNAPVGLMRLTLTGNEVSPQSETYQAIVRLCAEKDPLRVPTPTPPSKTPDELDSQSNVGSTGRK
ncbi:leucine-rich repeat-containing protein 71-like isoform X2 [Symsagittifera roscoffensis]|uniref:leucine-rich repeat-containing protein 71-like isoform X2 n=1 Tax=Symsagittifera roscoffensis TaxID=84072 RepID=UPI00307C69CF